MDNIYFSILRRMRTPLLALVVVYSVAVLGLVLVPGRDADGNPWHLGFFHAFYFVSYMATTIGFGELPREFSDAQRLWTLFCIYATVTVWIYSVGSLIALLQDDSLQRALAERRFSARVKRVQGPFFLIIGYGQTGRDLVRALTSERIRAVVIDADRERINGLRLEKLREYVPSLQADAQRPDVLLSGGLRRPGCRAVLALTSSNAVNLKVALAAKLLHPGVTVIGRSDSDDISANMLSFNTNHVLNPFEIFALHLKLALSAHCLTILNDWLGALHDAQLGEPRKPPTEGRWILCGFGRFGKAVYRDLTALGCELMVIEARPERTGTPPTAWIHGRGTEAETLEQAGIASAVGLIAGTDDDANNLSIVMTARALNPELYVVARENHLVNQELFKAVAADIRMHPSLIVANRVRTLLRLPLLSEFFTLARTRDETWACALVSRVAAMIQDRVPEVWEYTLDRDGAPAFLHAVALGLQPTLGTLLTDPRAVDQTVSAIVLLHQRSAQLDLLPDLETRLQPGDRLLLCGSTRARARMRWNLFDLDTLSAALGQAPQAGFLWRLVQPYLPPHWRI
ncbi:potassium channel protein [Rhabdochromatium marinum]|uniref:potassium channel protein n=1 Tax=Rhabdochromatium marinum TaxID=48729 RepID=UPI00190749FF|nr:potassium channel protein [Rhabdochromatium marinum]MBK1647872.1 potassium transporter TrkA [Rhabdochromatium marinum]